MKKYMIADCEVYAFVSPIIEATTYCMIQDEEALLIDAVYSKELYQFLAIQKIQEVTVLLTHGHYDHILGILDMQKTFHVTIVCAEPGREVLKNPRKNLTAVAGLINRFRDSEFPKEILPFSLDADYVLKDAEIFDWKGMKIETIFTPGHSEDSTCFLVKDKYLFAGDTILKNGEPMLRFPGGNKEIYEKYTKPVLESLKEKVIILPGHGEVFSISEKNLER